MRWPALALVFAIAGCAATPEQLSQMGWTELCNQNYHARQLGDRKRLATIYLTLQSKGALAFEGAEGAVRGEVSVGMPAHLVNCAWGPPSRVNRTRTQYSERLQLVYETYYGQTLGSRWRFVYVEHGKVTAVQD